MKTAHDVQTLLKRFGIFVYIGDRLLDLEMMEDEIKELYFSGLISKDEFQQSLIVLSGEKNKEKQKRK